MNPARRRRLPGWARDLLILGLLFWGLQCWLARDLPSGEAPPLAGRDLQGRPRSLHHYRGRPVLVHFWATWCPICRFEEGSIDAIARDHAVLSVAAGSGDAEALRAYMAERGLSFPVLVDEDGELARRWRVVGVPASFVVDGQGRIRWAGRGYASEWGLRLRLWLAA